MKDNNKSKQQLIAELTDLRQQVAELQAECSLAKQAQQKAEMGLQENEQRYGRLIETIKEDLDIQNKNKLMSYDAEHKQVIEAFQLSEDCCRRLVELSFDAVAIHCEEKFVFINNSGAKLYGATNPDELIGRPILDFVHPDFLKIVEARVRQMKEKGKGMPLIEERLVRLDGVTKDVELAAVPITYRGQPAVQVVIRDITARKQAEAERDRLLAIEHEQRLLAETLSDVFLTLAAQTRPEEVLDEILRQVQHIVSYRAANIVLLKDNTLYLVRYHGYDIVDNQEDMPDLDQPLSDFPLDAQVVQSRKPLIIPDTRQEPRWVTVSNLTWIRSFIAIPICLGQDVLGLLRLDSDLPGQFSRQDLNRLQPLANAAAVALDNARLYDRARRELANQVIEAESEIIKLNRRLLTLQYTGTAIASSADLQHALNTITKEMANTLKVEGCAIFQWVQATNRVSIMARHGLKQAWQNGQFVEHYPLNDFPLIKRALTERIPQQMTSSHPGIYPADLANMEVANLKTQLMVAMEFQDRVIGFVKLMDTRTERIFTNREIGLIQLLANQAASAIENTRLYDRIQQELAERKRAEQAVLELNRKLLALQYAGAAIATSLDLSYVLNTVTREMINLLEVEGCAISEWDQTANTVLTIAEQGLTDWGEDEDWKDKVYNLADYPLTKQVLVRRRAEQMTVSQENTDPGELAYMKAIKIKSLMMLPVEYQDRTVGLVEVMDSREERIFTADEIALAQLLANQAAIAIENARLYEQTQQERNLLRTLIDNLPDYIFVKDVEGRYLLNNASHMRILGAPTQDELIGKTDFETFPQDLAELYYADDQKVLKSGQPLINQEEFTVDHTGRKQWLLTTKVPVHDSSNQITGLVGISHDITKRKQREQALWGSERKFRTLAEMTAAAIFIFQHDQIRYVNSAAESITGYSRAELLKMNYWDLIHPDTNEVLIGDDIGSPLDEMPSPRYELNLLTKNGKERWIDNTLGVIEFEGELAVLGTAFDITSRRQMEEALRQSEANLRAIFDNTLQAFVLIAKNYRIQALNRTASQGIEQLSGKKVQLGDLVYDYVPETDLEEFNKCFDKVLKGGSVRLEKNVPIGNTSKWFEFGFDPVFADNEQVIGVCFSSINIDEHKRATETLAASEDRLIAEMQSILITTRALVREIELNNLLELIIAQAERLTTAKGAAVLLLEGNGQQLKVASHSKTRSSMNLDSTIPVQGTLAELALRRQQIQISSHAAKDDLTASIRALLHPAEIHSLLCAPLVVQSEDVGMLLIWSEHEQSFTVHDTRLIGLFADQAALALHNANLHARNHRLAIERERHRLARELHDSVTQSLYSMGLAAQTSLRLLGQDAENRVRKPIEHIHTLSQTALAEMRDHLYHLHPTALTDQGLIEALRKHCRALSKRYALEIEFEPNPEPTLSLQQQEALYYVTREALWNVIKHANALHVKIAMTKENKEVVLSIKDDGIGFNPADYRQRQTLGLNIIEERATSINATFELVSETGQGTEITIRTPVGAQESK